MVGMGDIIDKEEDTGDGLDGVGNHCDKPERIKNIDILRYPVI
jgi:hypothetical protein